MKTTEKAKMKNFFKRFKLLDWIIIAAVLSVIGLLTVATVRKNGGKPVYLKVTSGNGVYLYELSDNKTVSIRGKIGITQVEIKNGAARVLSSPCPSKTCMVQPAISHVGEWIACLPNEVFLQIVSDDMY